MIFVSNLLGCAVVKVGKSKQSIVQNVLLPETLINFAKGLFLVL